MTNSQFPIKRIFGLILFTLAFLERILFDLGPNIELVTTSMLLSAAYLGRKSSLWLTFLIMLATDLIIGNSNIFIFTWSGFLIPAFVTSGFFQKNDPKRFKRIGASALAGISSTAFFYLWTNFGVWILSSLYPKTLLGLLSSYINALPFLRIQAVSTLIFVPLGFTLTEAAIFANKKWSLSDKISAIVYKLKIVGQ